MPGHSGPADKLPLVLLALSWEGSVTAWHLPAGAPCLVAAGTQPHLSYSKPLLLRYFQERFANLQVDSTDLSQTVSNISS